MPGDEERPSSEPLGGAIPEAERVGAPIAVPSEPAPIEPADADVTRASTEEAESLADPVEVAPAPYAAAPMPPATAPAPLMPKLLAVIGVILILLLGANLYTLYNPPANDALTAAVADVGTVKQHVTALEAKSAATSTTASASATATTALDGRVTALAADVETLKGAVAQNGGGAAAGEQAKAALAPLDAKVTGLATDLTAVRAAVAALPKVDLGPLDDKVAALDKRLVPLEAYFTAPKSTEQVTDARQNGSAAETRAAPLAVIAQGVLGALDAGRPFPTEVKALATLGIDEPTLAPLRAVAESGAATRADLAAGFTGVQDAVVVAAAPVETGTMFDRILANATSVVKVTKTGDSRGSDAAAVAARIGDALKRGDLAAAQAAWDTLPASSKTSSTAWADRLTARIKADAAARSIETKAVAALAAAQ